MQGLDKPFMLALSHNIVNTYNNGVSNVGAGNPQVHTSGVGAGTINILNNF